MALRNEVEKVATLEYKGSLAAVACSGPEWLQRRGKGVVTGLNLSGVACQVKLSQAKEEREREREREVGTEASGREGNANAIVI